ncbi:MAG: CAP domain-containing protein [Leptolyngbya sp. Prado105]|jgi:uncharacterized protein YkwD|nr:CAP domain-containing protein [Leptolyngbya sp. Prado105]
MLNCTSSKPVLNFVLSIGISAASIIGSGVQAQTVSIQVASVREADFQMAQASLIAEMEQDILRRINRYRSSKGLSALTWSSDIAHQARSHSRNMAKKIVSFGHQGFAQRSKAISNSTQSLSTAENVAWVASRRDPAGQAVEAWLKSPKHLQNIEGNFNITGIGISISSSGEYYFTQDFAKR